MYCVWIAFEIVCIYFLWPETKGRTLEELTFLFEDKDLQDRQVIATEKQLFGGGDASVHEAENKGGTEEKAEDVEAESKASLQASIFYQRCERNMPGDSYAFSHLRLMVLLLRTTGSFVWRWSLRQVKEWRF